MTHSACTEKTTTGPAQGHLILHGGGNIECAIEPFVRLAGGPDASMIYFPTAYSDQELQADPRHLDRGFASRLFGMKKVHVLHTRDRKEANRAAFAAPLREARAVWFTGGRQWRLADVFLDTHVHKELQPYRGLCRSSYPAKLSPIQLHFLDPYP